MFFIYLPANMYTTLLVIHSLTRWLLLSGLLCCIGRAYKGFTRHSAFTAKDNAFRHCTATLSHLQLVIGIMLYVKSPVVKFFWNHPGEAVHHPESSFFALVHFGFMILAVIALTIGSALAKRKQDDRAKYKTMLVWFSSALFIIFIAIPWPFSPLAGRPYFRPL